MSRCTYYRRTCGLPAGIEPEAGRIVVAAGFVGGVTMPATLGRQVRDEMSFQGGEIALPSPADTGFRRWVNPPRDTFRPSGAVVVALTLTCAGTRRLPRVAR
ncbi:hypothetical protein [Nocardia xishanensis]|uniref:hypothetical protein n=1 Tax=Nocardia xishanensis TaxID=238964 RepID=UPI0033C2BD84